MYRGYKGFIWGMGQIKPPQNLSKSPIKKKGVIKKHRLSFDTGSPQAHIAKWGVKNMVQRYGFWDEVVGRGEYQNAGLDRLQQLGHNKKRHLFGVSLGIGLQKMGGGNYLNLAK